MSGLKNNQEDTSQFQHIYTVTESSSTNLNFGAKLSNLQLFAILIGIFFGVFVSGIDETILSTAQEVITLDFNSPNYITWIATAYLMPMVVFAPLYGKFCDIFGRKVCMLFALTIFALGSLGIGAGGIVSVSYIIISDLVPLEKRGTYLGLTSISFAISNMLGPILGGIIVEHVTWRVIFYINLPVAGVLIFISLFIIPLPWVEGSVYNKLKRIDYFGVLTLSAAIVLFVLSTTWGGDQYDWNSYQVILTLCLSFFFLGVFILVELKFATEPVLPPKMFNVNVAICSLVNAILGLIDFTIIYYLPVYFQTLQGKSASQSGYELAPFLVVSSIVAMLSGVFVNRVDSFRIPIWIGSAMMTVRSGLFCLISPNIPSWAMTVFSCILSFGIGCSLQITAIGAQASAEPEYIAIVAGFFNFTLNFGGTVGLSIDGAILNSYLNALTDSLDYEIYDTYNIFLLESDAYYSGLRAIFYFLLVTSLLALISSVFLKHKSLKEVIIAPVH
ncbi:MFS general substrate transporter [Conidiobolus coronatus NRRL 28638]|uniref:MFS general substrate transporter n=1 Tax=Conidiobolus coronatus (strain ATCC 28846 / CBS 209.66 / NRRL 28638) TaxID=796925 RepID=A0A137P8D5_CONC2|nr:MFS general substrate transporter [Conidiobolus coronatus NRRL 28638]|eukprot:KXN71276.1 MFS general substrate transporter [Conidiobolus coronatus NRRL 28638]